MSATKERFQLAQWVLERNLGFIAAAEVKVGVLVAIDTAMLGMLAAVFGSSQVADRTAWAYFFTLVAAGAGALGIACAAWAVMPRVKGPHSLLFFAQIAKHEPPDFANAFQAASDAALLEDCLMQIHRNAEIACDKFRWVRRGMGWSFFSAIPWIAALGMLVKT